MKEVSNNTKCSISNEEYENRRMNYLHSQIVNRIPPHIIEEYNRRLQAYRQWYLEMERIK